MSRTYVAHETALGRKVVVKMLSPDLAAGVSVDRFKREIQLAAMLQHPHIVPVLSAGDFDGLPWFTMPYVEGESLRARLGQGPLRILEATGILKDVARALEFAHSRGVVHRDIKPDNVLLAGSSATVTDFGIAKALTAARKQLPGSTLTAAGTSVGTPTYMPPEQAAGDPTLDQRSDIYSFGVLAYELLAGRPPFDGATPAKVIAAHFNEAPRDIRELRPDTPAVLADLVMRCLAKDVAERPQSASDVLRLLETVTSSGASDTRALALHGQVNLGKALGVWVLSALVVALTAWFATNSIGLPDWVFPGALGVMLAGLPAIGATWYVQRAARRSSVATPTATPGGSPSRQSTLSTIAVKASPYMSWRRTSGIGALAVGAFAAAVVAFMLMRAAGIGPVGSLIGAGKLARQERLIITDFKGPASDSALGLTVTEALRADLSESSALRVVPRRAMNETLRLMTLSPTTPIDFDVAREVATRDGVKAVLDGTIVALGGRYVVSTRLVSTKSGEELAAFREEASSQNDLIPAIGRIAKQLRAKVGESLKTVRDSKPLERVTTSSLEALSKYAEAQAVYDRTSDYSRSIPLLEQAVAIDSTFAMAWRRLSANLGAVGRRERGAEAAAKAYKYRDRLGDIERELTTAAYFQNGPATDDERALTAFESVLSRDSLNIIALNNAAIILGKRREFDRAATLQLRAAAQDSSVPNPIVWTNALGSLVSAGRIETADSLLRVWQSRTPEQPNLLLNAARLATSHHNYDEAERLFRVALPKVAGSVSVTEDALTEFGQILLMRGRVREGLQMQADVSERRINRGDRSAILTAGIDSVSAAVFIQEKPGAAREQLRRVLQRMPPDSFALVNRPNLLLLALAAFTSDAPLAEQLRADYQKQLVALGKTVDRPANEVFGDGLVDFSRGRYDAALEKFADAERKLHSCTYCVAGVRFVGLDRLGRVDSAIAIGEAYMMLTQAGVATSSVDARFRSGILLRLGELYESKGMSEKALARYQSFLDLWKSADPELQPQVRDVRGRVARLQAAQDPERRPRPR
jgi:tetratricopeptide (TPR) repeat protein